MTSASPSLFYLSSFLRSQLYQTKVSYWNRVDCQCSEKRSKNLHITPSNHSHNTQTSLHVHTTPSNHSHSNQTSHKYTPQQTITRTTLKHPTCIHHSKQSLVEHSDTPHVHITANNRSLNTQTPQMYTPHQAITRRTLKDPTCTHRSKQSLVQHSDTPYVHTTPSNHSYNTETPHMYTPQKAITGTTLRHLWQLQDVQAVPHRLQWSLMISFWPNQRHTADK